jgi:ATP-binding cassette, subfamily C, bacterial LapB
MAFRPAQMVNSLFGVLKHGRTPPPTLNGFAMPDALVVLAAMAGNNTSVAGLTAGLPVLKGQLDMRLAPIALARLGMEASWSAIQLDRLDSAALPVLAVLPDRSCVIVRNRTADGSLLVKDQDGERHVRAEALAAFGPVDVLSAGSADPVNGPISSDEKESLRANPKRWIVAQLMTERRLLSQLCLTAVLTNLLALAIPLYLRAIYDRVVPNLAMETLWALTLGVMIALLAELALKTVRTNFVDAIGMRLSHLVQHKVMNAIMSARMSKAPEQSGTVSIALRDIDSLAVTLPNAVAVFCVDLPFFLVFAAVLWHFGGPVVFSALLGGLLIAAIGLWSNLHLRKESARGTQLSQARANIIVDSVEGLSTLKAYQGQGQFMRMWDVLTDHAAMTSVKVRDWMEKPIHMAAFLVQIVTVLVIVIGVYQIKANALSVGALVACTLIAGRAMVPVSNAVGIISRAYQGLAQFASLSGLLALEPEADTGDPAVRGKSIRGDIALQTVSFTYGDNSRPALDKISLSIRRGEKIALIGKSGSGKSTLLHLLGGQQLPTGGRLLIDGFNADQYAASHLRGSIILHGQDMQLFDATLYENLTIGLESVDEARVTSALRAAAIDTFIAQQSDGLSYKAGPHGAKLSGGQRQAIMLARALVRDSAVLMLDEPTSAMDIGFEQAVINGLREATQDKTLIVATHRLALLELVDRVIWLDQGRIVADKPRAEVLAMFRAQSAANAQRAANSNAVA